MTLTDNLSFLSSQSIKKKEIYDSRMLYYLQSLNTHSDDERRKLQRFQKNAKNGLNTVTYETYKGYGGRSIGRYVAKSESGLQSLPKNIRAALCQKYYWDFDIVNCHPTFLLQLCKQWGFECKLLENYVQNRKQVLEEISKTVTIPSGQEPKDVIRNIMFGSGQYIGKSEYLDSFIAEIKQITKNFCEKHKEFYEWSKKKKEIQNDHRPAETSALAVFLQDVEKMIILTIEDYMKLKQRRVDTNMFDGGLLLKHPDEQVGPEDLLRGAEEWVLSKTGYEIKLLYKPLITTFKYPTGQDYIYDADDTIDDAFAAKKLRELAGDLLCKNNGKLFVFDTSKGLWTSEMDSIKELIHRFKDDLIFLQDTGKGIKKHNYGGSQVNFTRMLHFVTNELPNKVFDFDTSKGKLLFADGIYDMDTGEFSQGFDPDIHFAGRIDRPFPKADERDFEYEAYVNKILFQDPYLEEQAEQAAFFKTALARALYGDYLAKRAYVSVGEPNCGRGLLTKSLGCAFGSFVATFSSNNLLYNSKSSDDEAKKLAWFVPIANSRIAISNEISMMGRPVDSNILKAISSGGDKINARKLHENESPLISRTTVFLLTNDIPEMKPPDQGLINRLCVNELKKSYVAQPDPTDPCQAQEDKKLMTECESTIWMDALFWLMADEWNRFKQTDRIAPKPSAVVDGISDWVEKGVGIKSLLTERYEITKSEDDYITARDIHAYLKSKGCKDSETKRGKEIRKMTGISKAVKKVDGKTITVFFGLKELEDI